MQSYAIYWNEPDGSRFAGRMSLDLSAAVIEGAAGDGRRARRRLGFEQIASVRYQRGRLHIWRRDGAPVRIGSVDRAGALHELAERLQARVGAAQA